MPESQPRNLIVVAGHAPFRAYTVAVPENPERDEAWVLQSFQAGEPPLYLQHIRTGAELLARDDSALLIFSGGYTRAEAGSQWSEAATYLALARHYQWWNPSRSESCNARTALEDYSRDSYENLLFSLCRFRQLTGDYPRRIELVSWRFKRARFMAHCQAIGFPLERFNFVGSGEPIGLPAALRGEETTVRLFAENHYGSSGPLAAKRQARNPLGRKHPFGDTPGLEAFFRFAEDPAHAQTAFAGPWPYGLPNPG